MSLIKIFLYSFLSFSLIDSGFSADRELVIAARPVDSSSGSSGGRYFNCSQASHVFLALIDAENRKILEGTPIGTHTVFGETWSVRGIKSSFQTENNTNGHTIIYSFPKTENQSECYRDITYAMSQLSAGGNMYWTAEKNCWYWLHQAVEESSIPQQLKVDCQKSMHETFYNSQKEGGHFRKQFDPNSF